VVRPTPIRLKAGAAPPPPGPYGVTRAELDALLATEPRYRSAQVWEGLHRRADLPGEMTALPKALRARLADSLTPSLTEVGRVESADGATTKWAFALADGALIETVLMAYARRATVCVSTQAGCAMGCPFCATGQGGFTRHLRPGEIVEQVAVAMRGNRPRPVTHVVFMGMGEPLANYDGTWGAVRRLHDDMGISARRLTISTVGIIPGIKKMAAEPLPVTLAISLHAANDELRDRLIPVNRRYPLAELMAACRAYKASTHRRLSFEWALIAGVNDSARDAAELAALARPLDAHVNLIPLNETAGYGGAATGRTAARQFGAWLAESGVVATVRVTRGADITAACGQLAGPAAPA
jgi:23S rRNA (adenine2503-C2)-methyltransferase